MIPFFVTLLVPAELLLLSYVAHRMGWGFVFLTWVAGIMLGQALLRWRGRVFLREAQAAVARDQPPQSALVGGIAWYVAGILLIVPGYITDVLALVVLLPPVRRRALARFARLAEARIMTMGRGPGGFGQGNVYEGEAHRVEDDDDSWYKGDTPRPGEQETPRLPGAAGVPDPKKPPANP
jgi:UPF0716 protein FxsA